MQASEFCFALMYSHILSHSTDNRQWISIAATCFKLVSAWRLYSIIDLKMITMADIKKYVKGTFPHLSNEKRLVIQGLTREGHVKRGPRSMLVSLALICFVFRLWFVEGTQIACLRWCIITLVAFVWLFSAVCFCDVLRRARSMLVSLTCLCLIGRRWYVQGTKYVACI